MRKTLVKRMSFDESISNLSELICEAKLGAEKEGGGLSLIDNIKDAYTSLNDCLDVVKSDLTDKENEVSRLEGERDDLQESLEDASLNEMHGIQSIRWGTDNLLDQQVTERLTELLEKHGSLPVLRALESLSI